MYNRLTSYSVDILPQKEPFRFVDDIITLDSDKKSIVCSYTFSKDSFVYKGHFPDNPITPGVILIEAMAQSSILLISALKEMQAFDQVYLNKVEDMVFRKPVLPAQEIRITANLTREINSFIFVKSTIRLSNGDLVSKGNLIVAIK